MKKVITYGTFDLLHVGHINILRRAKELGDYLIVVISSDEFNWNEKHKKCYFTYDQRKALVEAYTAKYGAADIYECPVTIIESEIDMVNALADISDSSSRSPAPPTGRTSPSA